MVWLLINKNNEVENIIEYDGISPYILPEDNVLLEYKGNIIPKLGLYFDGKEIISDIKPQPISVGTQEL